MSRVVGIDLGTTNSLVAIADEGGPRILPDAEGRALLPSVVAGIGRADLIVGQAAQEHLLTSPRDVVYSVKRLMGRAMEDVADLLPRLPYQVHGEEGGILRVKLGPRWMTASQVSAEILRALKDRAEHALRATVTGAVITVPAYFNDAQRQATRDAGRIAGLDVLRIVNEPTAACLAYGLQERREGNIAVYDLGGGTFDISILRLSDGIFEVLATNGDTQLGGDDIDRLLANHFAERIAAKHGEQLQTPELLQRLRLAAEQAKIALSTTATTHVTIALEGRTLLDIDYSLAEFEALIRPLVARTLEPCRAALEDADLLQEDIDEVVMVGGSTRIPLVRAMVGEYFERTPHTELNPEEVVALGAAVQGRILAGDEKSILLLDVTPLSLGIEAYGGVMQRIIPRNTTIPASVTELFTTFVDSQTHVDVHVLQGERDIASGNRSLARFKLGPLPPLPAGMHRIEVTFMLDADGVLGVHAKDQRTGREHAIQVKPTYGLTDNEVEEMLLDAQDASRTDATVRQMVEERNYATMELSATEKGMRDAGDLIDEIDAIVIEEQMERLREALKGEDLLAMRAARDRLSGATQPLAVAMMNAALVRNLKGKKASEVLGPGSTLPGLTPAQVNPEHQREVAAKVELGKKDE
jgi:molecular chaperone DnaK